MPHTEPSSTDLTTQYTTQISSDLERNIKDQERITAEIESLQQQLLTLQHNHTVLKSMQQTLTAAGPATNTDTRGATSAPRPASSKPGQGRLKAASSTTPTPASPRKAAAKSPSVKPKSAGGPSLVELIHRHLEQQGEPRSAAEITSSLTQDHPDRTIKVTVVRTTVEGLVSKGRVHRNKQGSSVFYTAAATQRTVKATPGGSGDPLLS